MRNRVWMSCLLALAVCLAATPLFAEDFATEYEKKVWQDEQGDPGSSAVPLNCSAAIPITCGTIGLAGTNVGAVNQTSTYNCTSFTEGGGEAIYVFSIASTQTIVGRINSGTPDLDLLLLTACDNTACIAAGVGGTTTADSVKACLQPGTYYLVVDGFGTTNAGRAFTISLTCDDVTCSPPCNITCTTANDLCAGAIALPMGNSSILGNLTCDANSYTLTTTGSCTRFTAAGRDVVYKATLGAGCMICVSYDRCNANTTDFDRSIYLLNTCPTGTPPITVNAFCVAGEDSTVTNGGPEDFCYTTAAAGTYYLVADAFGTNIGGQFSLVVDITCPPTATEPSTWGNVKSLFR